MTTPTSTLAREEWDFDYYSDQIGSRLYSLATYEFGREVNHVVEAYRQDPAEQEHWHRLLLKLEPNNPDFQDCFPYFDSPGAYNIGWISPEEPSPDFDIEVIDAPRGFPDTPYLLIPRDQITIAHAKAPRFVWRHYGFSVVRREGEDWIDRNRQYAPPEEVHTVRTDWNCTNETIIADFAEWVSSQRPPDREALKKQTKGGDRKLRDDLRALGVWRLLRINDDDVNKARKYVWQIKKTDLFVRAEDWRDNQDRAQAILDEWGRRQICGG